MTTVGASLLWSGWNGCNGGGPDDENLEALPRHADTAMYAAKRQGKGSAARSDCAVLGVAS